MTMMQINTDMWVVLGILAAAIFLFISEWLRVDIVALAVIVVLMISGVLSPEQALAGFSNPTVLAIAALFVVGGGVLQTGLAAEIGRRILRVAGHNETRLILLLMLVVALLSSIMSDTGTVAVLLPAVIVLARTASINPSKLLIPLSFGALLGGASTLIGTPPNLIVSNLLREQGLQPFGFFSFTPMGLILIFLGVAFILTIGRRLLPDRETRKAGQRVETPEELLDLYKLPDNLFRLRVRRTSNIVGKTVAQTQLGADYHLTVLDVIPGNQPRPASILHLMGNRPGNEDVGAIRIQAEDILLVQGFVNDVSYAAARLNLGVQPAQADDEDALISEEVGIAEVVLPPRSSLQGKTLPELRFGSTYHLTVLSINRPGDASPRNLKATTLQFGDILLVQGPWKNIIALKDRPRDFVVVGQPESMRGAPNREKAAIASIILISMVALIITNLLPVATASLLAALAMVLFGCLSMDEAYQAVDWRSILLIAGMLPMSTALEKVHLVDMAASALVQSVGAYGPLAVVAGLFILTSLFTQVLSNTATTVLIAPIAFAAAQSLGLHPQAFLMAVAIAASMGFASPVASPVNTLVMGAGGYRFGDYLRVGGPLILIMLAACLLVLPRLFPF